MFTGIVTAVGRVSNLEKDRRGARLTIRPPSRYGRFRRGESVCVSGVCLTAVRSDTDFIADLSRETLRRSTLEVLCSGDSVNLERALVWGDRLSGHFVLGHVDGVARLLAVQPAGNSWIYRFSIPSGLSRFIVAKGSIAVDGISLTVARRRSRAFDVAIIPETRRRTTLRLPRLGSGANIEVDVFARYGVLGWRERIGVSGRRRKR